MPSGLSAQSWTATAASITCEGEVPILPASRLKIPKVTKRFGVAGLSSGDTIRQVKIDFGKIRAVNRISLIRPRRNSINEDNDGAEFEPTDLVRHKLSSTDAHDGDVYDSGWITSDMVHGYGYHDHIVPLSGASAVRTALFASLEFDAQSRTQPPKNYVWFGRLDYYNLWQFQIGFAAPFDYGWRDNSTATRVLDGSGEYVNDRTKGWREINMLFRSTKHIERTDLLDFLEKTRTGGRFYLVSDMAVADPRGCFVVRNRTPNLTQTDRAFGRFELSMVESL